MIELWENNLIDSTTFILGNKKNAGKTTFMNLCLNKIRKHRKPAICSVGIDGESFDLIDGNEKPWVKTFPGDVVVTTHAMIKKSSGQFKWLKVFPYKTVLGQLVVVETLRQGTIELVGAEHNNDLKEVLRYLKIELQISTILIDGAANRITPLNAQPNTSFYYVMHITRMDLKKSLEAMQNMCRINDFPLYHKRNRSLNVTYEIVGALTPSKLVQIPQSIELLIVESAASFFINNKQLIDLNRKMKIEVKNKFELNAIVAVLKDVEPIMFIKKCEEYHLSNKVILNPYVN